MFATVCPPLGLVQTLLLLIDADEATPYTKVAVQQGMHELSLWTATPYIAVRWPLVIAYQKWGHFLQYNHIGIYSVLDGCKVNEFLDNIASLLAGFIKQQCMQHCTPYPLHVYACTYIMCHTHAFIYVLPTHKQVDTKIS